MKLIIIFKTRKRMEVPSEFTISISKGLRRESGFPPFSSKIRSLGGKWRTSTSLDFGRKRA
jgi:hypothetical protein